MSEKAPPGPLGASVLRAAWNLRVLALFLVGPVVGVVLVGSVFGLPAGLRDAACAMFLFSLGLFAMLIRGEHRRLAAASRRGKR